jgi:glyoxylase-like metal-dependent hydrolase (beta-lactamase superfamily II)
MPASTWAACRAATCCARVPHRRVGCGPVRRPAPGTRAGLTGAVPVVDTLAVRVVTDSYHHAFEPGRKINDLTVQRFAFALAKGQPPSKALQNEWGLSLHLESRQGEGTRQILIDFGYTPQTLNNNLELLGIDPAQLDALMLSHGHYDHFGGLNGFLAQHQGRLKKGCPSTWAAKSASARAKPAWATRPATSVRWTARPSPTPGSRCCTQTSLR